MLYFGIIRPYKGVENLIDKFAQMPGADARLRIVGKPQTDLLRDAIKAGASGDSRIELKLEFVPDTELAKLIEESAIVVLPYHEMHNSGAALLALSLDRPVLAPATAANVALRREVGERWLHLYDGPALETKDLEDAYAFLENGGPFDRPNLSGRDWDRIGESHSAIYHGLAGNRRFKR
jgi:beta-1,4-mannosyltransferase